MKYLFVLSENFYRLIKWEWNFLKQLRRKRRKNIFLRCSFALFSLLSILIIFFFPPYLFGILLGEGMKFSNFFLWIWILNLKFFWKIILLLLYSELIYNKDYFFFSMPKIFKQNKFALLGANILIIVIWVSLSSAVVNLFIGDNSPFYIYKIGSLIKFLPPIWLTWFLWIKRGGLKR